MTETFEQSAPVAKMIGERLLQETGLKPGKILLIAEAGSAWAGGAIFFDEQGSVIHQKPSTELLETIIDSWESEADRSKWSVMELEVNGTRFSAEYDYPDEVDEDEDFIERRERILHKHFGDKPVRYGSDLD